MIEAFVFVIKLVIKSSFYIFIFTALFAIITALISAFVALGLNNTYLHDVIRIIDIVAPFNFITLLSWLVVLASSIFSYRVAIYVKSHVNEFLA